MEPRHSGEGLGPASPALRNGLGVGSEKGGRSRRRGGRGNWNGI